MKCLVCRGKTRVVSTVKASDSVCRVRVCTECGTQFNTIEIDAAFFEKEDDKK